MNSIWLDFPVKDIEKSKAFFRAIGLRENTGCKDPNFGSFFIGDDNFVMMLSSHDQFTKYSQNEIPDPSRATEVLLNLGAGSREEVDGMVKKVKTAGGKIYSEPAESEGWMYGFGFEDLDGHRWYVLYMDSAGPQQN